MTLLGWLIRLMVLLFCYKCKFPSFGRVITRDLVNSVGHSPAFKILLQTEGRTSIMASPPVLTNSAGMLSTTAGFPMLSDLTSSLRIGRGPSPGIFAQSSTVGSP